MYKALIFSLVLFISSVAYSNQIQSFTYTQGSKISSEGRSILLDAVQQGKEVSLQKVSDGEFRMTTAEHLPENLPLITANEYLGIYLMATADNPEDEELAKAGEKLANIHVNSFGEDTSETTQQYLLREAIGNQMKLPPRVFKDNPVFFSWVKEYNIHNQSQVFGHQWKVNRYQVPQVLLSSGRTSWLLLQNEGIVDHHGKFSPNWTYTKDGFILAKEEVSSSENVSSTEESESEANPFEYVPQNVNEQKPDDLKEFILVDTSSSEGKQDIEKPMTAIYDGAGGWNDWLCEKRYGLGIGVGDSCKLVPLNEH